MITIEKPEVWGFEHAIRGMRNPLNSWDKSDSGKYECSNQCDHCDLTPHCLPLDGHCFKVGDNDLRLMRQLIKGGQPHRKFLRQIMVSVDITAPLYWWKEFDTYKVGTTANSCSTMHKIHARDFTLDDFSHEHLDESSLVLLQEIIKNLNSVRTIYINGLPERDIYPKDKIFWWQLVQLLPTSYNQKRTVTMTYENLINILEYRRGHKLDEWHTVCDWIVALPLGELLKEGVE